MGFDSTLGSPVLEASEAERRESMKNPEHIDIF